MRHINKKIILFILTAISLSYSCKKFLEVGSPKDKITPAQVFEDDVIATSAITGIYSKVASSGFASGSNGSVSVLAGLSSDELKSHNASWDGFYQAEISSSNPQISSLWTDLYKYIYSANAILEGLQTNSKVTENTNKQLVGESKFIRAFCYFYLVNLFGEVPLNLTTDYRKNESAGKSTKDKIYAQIILDLNDASDHLSPNYITSERIRPNKWAARALLSRVYLYLERWKDAEDISTEIIEQKNLYSLVDDLDKIFLKNSNEAIWQLMPPAGSNTMEGNLFVLNSTPTFVSLVPYLSGSFVEATDTRKTKWIREYSNTTGKYYYPFKYKVRSSSTVTEYSMIIRLAEIHLIRAEARARVGLVNLALEDLNLIRKRAGILTPLTDLDQGRCILEVEEQRRLELFSEWGHRWLDLKRTGRASVILAPLKGVTWKDADVLYPIPDNEITRNRNINQNLGY